MGRLADYSDRVTVEQLDGALRAAGCDGVWHYLCGDFARRLEDPAVVAGIRARGWSQGGISVPSLGQVTGSADAARVRAVYGFGGGFRLALDIEPDEFRADPRGWAAAADRWCDQVRAAGLSPGVYGVDITCAACASRADWIWRAKPGMCDPAGPGLDAGFFAGRRIVQCGAGVWGGVSMDVSYSQFAITPGGANMAQLDDVQNSVNDQWSMAVDGRGSNTGRVPIVVALNSKLDLVLGALGVEKAAIDAAVADLVAEAVAVTAARAQFVAVLARLDALLAAVQGAGGGAVDLTRVYAAQDGLRADLVALGVHLGQAAPAPPTA